MKETNKYKLLIFIRYLGDALYYPFISLYLKSLGLIEDKVGFLLSITPLIGILLNPIYNKLSKNLKITRIILVIISVFEASFIGIIGLSNNFYYLVLMISLIAIFGTSHYGLMDSLIAVYSSSTNTDFSKIRIYGSLAYIIGTTIGGYIVKVAYLYSFILSMILMIISALLYLYIKPIDCKNNDNNKITYNVLLKNKSFISFLIIHCLIMSLHNSSFNFFSLFLETKGIDSNGYGLIYSLIVIFEVITLLILPLFKNNKDVKKTHIIIIILCFIRMFINSLDLPNIYYILVSIIQGMYYALLMNVTYTHLVKLVGEKQATNGNMLLVLVVSLLNIIFNNINGNIIKYFSYSIFYKYMCVWYILIFIYSIYRFNNKKLI